MAIHSMWGTVSFMPTELNQNDSGSLLSGMEGLELHIEPTHLNFKLLARILWGFNLIKGILN